MSWNQRKFKFTSSSKICKFDLVQFRKKMVETIDDEGFKIVHHKTFSIAMRQDMKIGQSNVRHPMQPKL
jgi:hypothetical protein